MLRELRAYGIKPQIELKVLPESLDDKFVNTLLKYFPMNAIDSIVSADRSIMTRLANKYGVPLATPVEDINTFENQGIFSKTSTIAYDSVTLSDDVLTARKKGYDIAIKGSANVTNIQWLYNDVLLDYGVHQALSDSFAPNKMGGVNILDVRANSDWSNITISGGVVTDGYITLNSLEYISTVPINVLNWGGIKGSFMCKGKFTLSIIRSGSAMETHSIDTNGASKRIFISRLIKSTANYSVQITSDESNSILYDFELKINQFDI